MNIIFGMVSQELMFPGKSDPFILDFVNEPEIIYQSFKPYYDSTELVGVTDPQSMEKLKYELDHFQVYHGEEVEAFALIFYKPIEKQTFSDHARMEKPCSLPWIGSGLLKTRSRENCSVIN